MRKGFRMFFLILILLFCVNFQHVEAELTFKDQGYMIKKLASSNPKINSVTIQGDIAVVRSSGTVLGYYVGTTNSVNASTTYYQAVRNNVFYAGVKNGTYYFWISSGLNGRAIMYSQGVKVTTSCSNQVANNATGSGTVERCFVYNRGGSLQADQTGALVTCADGYELPQDGLKVASNGCRSVTTQVSGQDLRQRYCKVVYSYNCVKTGNTTPTPPPTPTPSVAAASLTSLSVSEGNLNPGFSSGNKTYSLSVASTTSSIKVNAVAASGSSFVSGFGPRNASLNYGANAVQVKVKNSAGKVTTYTINVSRADGRSNVNTLSSLSVSAGELSPAFNTNVFAYNVNVATNVAQLNIGAALTDSKSSFVDGFGPRTVNLNPGLNNVFVKVRSESGKNNVYTLNIMRATEDAICTTGADDLALLKQIKFVSDNKVDIDSIDFSSKVFNYTDVKVPYEIGNLTIEAATVTEGDTFVIDGAENLEVGKEREVKIVVSSKNCSSVTKTYTLYVTRQEKKTLDSNAEIDTMTVAKHSEVKFEQNKENYKVKLKKKENKLDIKITTVSETTDCKIEGNENLGIGSTIKIRCTAEDGTTANYTITVSGREKGTNVFLLIIVVIVVILLLVYIVLRLLGYKIVINMAVIGAFFRGITEKIQNMFNK